jgi:tRNA A37 N6-isopentenylltransferase MiaA
MRYARRQLIWFRKEPNVTWLDGAGESAEIIRAASAIVAEFTS